MTGENVKLLKNCSKSLGIILSDAQIDLFDRYLSELTEWNKKFNLTAIEEEKEIVLKHFIDSISAVPFLPKNSISMIDVGTGAGFPGIPIKIVLKDLTVTLLDSLEKRVRFLNHIILSHCYDNMTAIHKRAEELAHVREHREAYDVGISRAVAPLPVLCEYVIPFVKVGGYFIAMKGSDIQDELKASEKAVDILGGSVEDVKNFLLPGTDIKRHLILIKKIRQTPTMYPRKSGKPSKSPLQ
ncbi:MAG: 16S rRNA (guanine(527)-N(7))-methyltransferase RsmG [Clostridiaceae bacterium]|nr:16S rRNA (guanine(527)-N(7))-methyltransferase RsmG [Clostridiaceae bacterium]